MAHGSRLIAHGFYPKMLTLTPATQPAQYDLFTGLITEYAHTDLADAQNSSIWKDLQSIPGRYAPPKGGVLLAYWANELAGCAAFAPTTHAGLAEMKRVYVKPAFRRYGMARALAQAIIIAAQQAGYEHIAISTWGHNARAIALYHQLGFSPVPPFKDHASQGLVYLGRSIT